MFIAVSVTDGGQKRFAPMVERTRAAGGIFSSRRDTDRVEIQVVAVAKEVPKAFQFPYISYGIRGQERRTNTREIEGDPFNQGVVIAARLLKMILEGFAESLKGFFKNVVDAVDLKSRCWPAAVGRILESLGERASRALQHAGVTLPIFFEDLQGYAIHRSPSDSIIGCSRVRPNMQTSTSRPTSAVSKL